MDCSWEKSLINGPIARAVAQREEAMRIRTLEKAPRQRLSRAITMIDSMIGSLELLNLKGRASVPVAVESRFSSFLQAIATHCDINMDSARSPEELMDELFTVQQELLARRAGPGWEWAYLDEECKSRVQFGIED